MVRRQFIALIGGIAAAWLPVARAQPAKVPLIGWLNAGFSHDALFARFTDAFRAPTS
jgi:hypothetical protein